MLLTVRTAHVMVRSSIHLRDVNLENRSCYMSYTDLLVELLLLGLDLLQHIHMLRDITSCCCQAFNHHLPRPLTPNSAPTRRSRQSFRLKHNKSHDAEETQVKQHQDYFILKFRSFQLNRTHWSFKLRLDLS